MMFRHAHVFECCHQPCNIVVRWQLICGGICLVLRDVPMVVPEVEEYGALANG